MGDPSGYWTWDDSTRDYFHDQQCRSGVWNRIWARSTPQPAVREEPRAYFAPPYNSITHYHPGQSPLPPVAGGYIYDPYSAAPGIGHSHAGLARLPGTLHHHQQASFSGSGPLYVDGRGTERWPAVRAGTPHISGIREGGHHPSRRPSILTDTSHGRVIDTPAGYARPRRLPENQPPPALWQPSSHSEYFSNDSQRGYEYASRLDRAEGKLRAPSVEPDDSYSAQLSDSENDDKQLSRGVEDSRASYTRKTYASGSSREARASSASYSGPKPSPASAMPQKGPSYHEPSLSLYRGPSNNLDPGQFERAIKPREFFVVGKVIKVFYNADAGEPFPGRESVRGNDFTTVAPWETAHHTRRRFVIVKKWADKSFCYGLPITTYGGRGTTKAGVDPRTHTMIFTGTTPPRRLQGEEKMSKDPLHMTESGPEEKLDPVSRLNLRRHRVIEYSWEVKEIGRISQLSLPKLMSYWNACKEYSK